jgi:hypothetical protein
MGELVRRLRLPPLVPSSLALLQLESLRQLPQPLHGLVFA